MVDDAIEYGLGPGGSSAIFPAPPVSCLSQVLVG